MKRIDRAPISTRLPAPLMGPEIIVRGLLNMTAVAVIGAQGMI